MDRRIVRRVAAVAVMGALVLTSCSATSADDASVGGMASDAGVLAPVSPGPYESVTYDAVTPNPAIDTASDPTSTFGLDVDTGSYNVVRTYLIDGHRPDPASVRVEELINAVDGGDAPPEQGTFAVRADGGPTLVGADPLTRLVRVSVRSRPVDDGQRRPANLVFVVDTSGSMQGDERLGLVRRSLTHLVGQLRPGDTVGLVRFGSEAEVVLPPTSVAEADRIIGALDDLESDGSTNAAAGIALGYDLATKVHEPGDSSRVILASDGVANVGTTDLEGLLALFAEHRRDIQLLTVGFGMGTFNDALMEQLADKGNGFYAYVDTMEEAERLFGDELTSTIETVAADAKVQVRWDPALVQSHRLIGYENRAMSDEAFDDPTADAGEIGAGHSVTALYEVRLTDAAAAEAGAVLGEVELRWAAVPSGEPGSVVAPIESAALAPSLGEAAPSFRLAAAVAAWGEALRDGNPDDPRISQAAAVLDGLPAELRADERVADVRQLVAASA